MSPRPLFALALLAGCATRAISTADNDRLSACASAVKAWERAAASEHVSCVADADCLCIDTRWLRGECWYATSQTWVASEQKASSLLAAQLACGSMKRSCPDCVPQCVSNRCTASLR